MSNVEQKLQEELRLSNLEHEINDIKEDLKKLTDSVDALVSAWKAANWLVGFVKWLAGLATAVAVLYSFFKGFK